MALPLRALAGKCHTYPQGRESFPAAFSFTTPREMTAPETGHGTDPRRLRAAPPPTRWYTHRFLAVLWDREAAKPQLQQNKEGTGEYRVEKEV